MKTNTILSLIAGFISVIAIACNVPFDKKEVASPSIQALENPVVEVARDYQTEISAYLDVVALGLLDLAEDGNFRSIALTIANSNSAIGDASDYFADLSEIHAAYVMENESLLDEMRASIVNNGGSSSQLDLWDTYHLDFEVADFFFHPKIGLPYKNEYLYGQVDDAGVAPAVLIGFYADESELTGYGFNSNGWSPTTMASEEFSETPAYVISLTGEDETDLYPFTIVAGRCEKSGILKKCVVAGSGCKCKETGYADETTIE